MNTWLAELGVEHTVIAGESTGDGLEKMGAALALKESNA